MLASLSGKLFVWKKLGEIIERNLSFLVSFSAGVFFFITFLILEEIYNHADDFLFGSFWIVLGIIIFYFLFKLLPEFHHHHDEKNEGDKHSHIDTRRILFSDGIHNIADGILLASSFTVSIMVGAFTTLSIFIHEFVQEVSEFFVLKQAGFSTKKALLLNFAVSGTILIGSIGSFFLFEAFEVIEVPLLGIAAGSFLVVVVKDLIPHSIRHSKTKTQYAKHVGWFVLGILIMLVVNLFFGH